MRSVEYGVFRPDADLTLPGIAATAATSPLDPSSLLLTGLATPPRRHYGLRHRTEKPSDGQPETVFPGDGDGRRAVTQSRSYPYSAICSLQIINNRNEVFYGTGFLAGPRLVLTAGHNVYYHGEGFMKHVLVCPGLNGEDRRTPPMHSAVATRFATVEAWIRDGNRQLDFGAIFLPTDLGHKVGALAVTKLTDGSLASLTVNLVGYPIDLSHDARHMYHQAARVTVEANRLLYLADTEEGQSGSPVFYAREIPGAPGSFEYHAVGIHNTGYPNYNAATRINDAVFSQIAQWRKTSEQLS